MKKPFYAEGLKFECQQCSNCCRHAPGYVFLSSQDLDRLSRALGMGKIQVLKDYCNTVSVSGITRISIREKSNFDCVFWEKDTCTIYVARPLQCRSFPFWPANLGCDQDWDNAALSCPGIGRGQLHSQNRIEKWIKQRAKEKFL